MDKKYADRRAKAAAVLLRAAGQITQTSNRHALAVLRVETAFETPDVEHDAIDRIHDVLDGFTCDRHSVEGAARVFQGAALADLFPADRRAP